MARWRALWLRPSFTGMLNLTLLRTFVVLCRERSFTKTARVLHMTQSGVSAHIKKLEAHFGTALVTVRGTRGVEPTEAGRTLKLHAAQLLEREGNLKALVTTDREDVGTCRFASPGAFGMKMYSFLLALNVEHRGLSIHYTYAPNPRALQMLRDDEVDVAFVTAPPNDPTLHTRVVDQERLMLVVPASLRRVDFLTLLSLGFVNHPDGFHHAGRLLARNFPESFTSMEAFPVRAFNNQITRILEPVALGLGFTALPEFACRAYVDQQSIVLVDLPNPVVDPVSWVERRGAVLPARFHMIQAAMGAPSHPDGTFHPHPPIPPRTARKRRQP